MIHDQNLFTSLLEAARKIEPEVRKGSMFGCPAIYNGRKLAACIVDVAVGLRIPAPVAQAALDAKRVTAFQPHGKVKMREWVQINGGASALTANIDLLTAAIEFAKTNNG